MSCGRTPCGISWHILEYQLLSQGPSPPRDARPRSGNTIPRGGHGGPRSLSGRARRPGYANPPVSPPEQGSRFRPLTKAQSNRESLSQSRSPTATWMSESLCTPVNSPSAIEVPFSPGLPLSLLSMLHRNTCPDILTVIGTKRLGLPFPASPRHPDGLRPM